MREQINQVDFWLGNLKREKKVITKIKINNKIVTEQKDILKTFWEYYVKLFEKNKNNEVVIKQILEKLKIKRYLKKLKNKYGHFKGRNI